MLGTCGPARKTSNGGLGRMACGTGTIDAQTGRAPGVSPSRDCVPGTGPGPGPKMLASIAA